MENNFPCKKSVPTSRIFTDIGNLSSMEIYFQEHMNSPSSYRFISINNLKHKCFYLSYKFSCIFSTKAKMKSLQVDYTDAEIFGIFVGGGFTIAFIFCIGICTMFHGYVRAVFVT